MRAQGRVWVSVLFIGVNSLWIAVVARFAARGSDACGSDSLCDQLGECNFPDATLDPNPLEGSDPNPVEGVWVEPIP